LALGSAESALLSRLVAAFNLAMRVNMVQDGRLAGIVFADSEITESASTSNPRNYLNVTQRACNEAVALPDCSTATLVVGATGLNFLWADDLRPGPTFHQALGAQALTRAVNNPF
jgi:phospholipase/lecithinase/hemolysin